VLKIGTNKLAQTIVSSFIVFYSTMKLVCRDSILSELSLLGLLQSPLSPLVVRQFGITFRIMFPLPFISAWMIIPSLLLNKPRPILLPTYSSLCSIGSKSIYIYSYNFLPVIEHQCPLTCIDILTS
jgi:hypothetical protein